MGDFTRGSFIGVCLFLFLTAPVCFTMSVAHAENGYRVVVLPFRIHALEPPEHLQKGLQEAFADIMTQKGIRVVPPEVVNTDPLVRTPVPELKDLYSLGERMDAKWILSGSLTQVGRKISLDIKLLDVTERKPPFSVFMVEDDADNLTSIAERAVNSLYNQIVGVVQIDSVRVTGNRRIESEAVLAVVQSRKGEEFNPERLDEDLRAVYKMGFFNEVTIETEDGPGGKIVVIRVVEKPSIARIDFQGNERIKDEELEEEIGIKPYSILNFNEVKQGINRLKELYRQKGYYNVEIEDKVEDLPQNEVALIYRITEGEKVYITSIDFIGNTRFDDDDLKDLMETNEKGFFSWITKAGLLDRKKLEFDIHKITAFYHNHGHIKAKVGDPEVTYEEGRGLFVKIEVIEGPQYVVDEVKISGQTEDDIIADPAELMRNIKIGREKYFNREVVRKDTLVLAEFYADEGYAYANVVPLINEDDETHLVDIEYSISKGDKVRIERINITGNVVTRDKVIRRELKLVEKEYFSGKALKRSTENLHRLGYFEDVEVQTRRGAEEDLMVLDVNVKERPTGSFSIGAGYSSFDNAIGMFQIAQNNLFGYGQKLSAAARLGSRTQQFDVRFIEPWLMDKPVSMNVDLFNWEREYYEYTKDSIGGALGFGFPIGIDEEYTRATVQYGYEDADISDVDENAALVIKEMIGRNVTSSFTLGLIRDSKDRPWHTTRGSVNSISFEYAGGPLGGDVYFNKYLARSAWYFPLPKDTVFMIQGRWGYVEQRSGGKLPIYQKFRLGGINSVRGFDYAEISPRDPATNDRIGGEKMMVYNLEYRFHLARDAGLVGLFFFDAGNVFTKNENYTFSGIRRSAGVGVRWYSPIGPLRLEYGWNLDQQGDESSGGFEFSVGGLF